MPTEINCFKIHGLEQLEAEYGIYQLAGLRRDSAEFFANVQRIIDRLSRQMKAPVSCQSLARQPRCLLSH
jgi:hypothetical protein